MSLKLLSTICLLVLASACSTEAPLPDSPNLTAQLPMGFVDLPKAGQELRGRSPVAGWVLSEAGIQSVRIYVDRTLVGTATLGVERTDIPKVFPGFPGAEKSGWTFELDTSTISEGKHEVIAQAHSSDSASRDLGSIPVLIVR